MTQELLIVITITIIVIIITRKNNGNNFAIEPQKYRLTNTPLPAYLFIPKFTKKLRSMHKYHPPTRRYRRFRESRGVNEKLTLHLLVTFMI